MKKLSREILFRGQTRKRGQKVNMAGDKLPGIWVYGGIFPGTGDHSIIYGDEHEELSAVGLGKHVVYSDTVGQYTEMTDKAGHKAFEHDIIKHRFGDEIGIIRYGEYNNPFGDDGFGGHVGFYVDWVAGTYPQTLRKDLGYWIEMVEIIGNIHDTPELLEGSDHGKH